MGAFIGGTNIPERWCPGSLDLIFNSHHVMHVMVVYAVYQLHLGKYLVVKCSVMHYMFKNNINEKSRSNPTQILLQK